MSKIKYAKLVREWYRPPLHMAIAKTVFATTVLLHSRLPTLHYHYSTVGGKKSHIDSQRLSLCFLHCTLLLRVAVAAETLFMQQALVSPANQQISPQPRHLPMVSTS
jgi:hypothetical protein